MQLCLAPSCVCDSLSLLCPFVDVVEDRTSDPWVGRTLPLKFALALVKDVPKQKVNGQGMLIGRKQTHSLPSTRRMPSLRVHFHLFFTRWTLS